MGTSSSARILDLVGRVAEHNIGWIPARTARLMLGVSRQRVYQLLNEGKLSGRVVDGTVLVALRSVEARIALLTKEGG